MAQLCNCALVPGKGSTLQVISRFLLVRAVDLVLPSARQQQRDWASCVRIDEFNPYVGTRNAGVQPK